MLVCVLCTVLMCSESSNNCVVLMASMAYVHIYTVHMYDYNVVTQELDQLK